MQALKKLKNTKLTLLLLVVILTMSNSISALASYSSDVIDVGSEIMVRNTTATSSLFEVVSYSPYGIAFQSIEHKVTLNVVVYSRGTTFTNTVEIIDNSVATNKLISTYTIAQLQDMLYGLSNPYYQIISITGTADIVTTYTFDNNTSATSSYSVQID